ncbi:VanW family protein [Clostridium polynesiense]|uniref:VanW family protein n=1 Tax=Clostridium polynesiense TaxID=1325933 RepID=UPI00069401A5|nr:VanW family protein [Clostridium polynesiense]
MSENKKVKRSKTPFIIAGIAAAAIIGGASAYTAYTYSKVNQWTNIIYPGIKIGSTEVSGKTKEEALKILNDRYNSKINSSSITAKVGDKEYNLSLDKLGIKYNLEEAVNEAYGYGKELNMFKKYSLIKNPIEKNIPTAFTYNKEVISNFSKDIANELDKEPVNAKIKINEGNIKITQDVKGYKVDTEDLENQINSRITEGIKENIIVQAKAEAVEPKITAETLGKINSKISSYTTNYTSSTAARAHNVDLSASSINGTLLMPGEVFSYNKTVGERSKARGYQDAAVYVGDKVEQGIGGGICQTSSTLYVAAMMANLRSVDRTNHSMPVSYLKVGMDATVVWGAIDYKFKNNYDFPVYIEAVTKNRNLTFNIYGNKEGMGGKSYQLISDIVKVNQPKIRTIEDPNLEDGKTEIEKKPVTGYVAKSYLVTYQNGKEIKREAVSTDTYKTVDGVIRKGTKKAPAAPQNNEAAKTQ